MSLVRAKIEKAAEISSNQEEVGRLQSIVERSSDATVKVAADTYPNVEIWINNSKVLTKEHVNAVEFVEHDGNVVMMSMVR